MSGAETVVAGQLEGLLGPFLVRQSWCREALGPDGDGVAGDMASLRQPLLETVQVLSAGPPESHDHPGLARLVCRVGSHRFQLVVGWREPGAAAKVLGGSEGSILGAVPVGNGAEVLVYDALADSELLVALLAAASGGAADARRARLVESLTSHASIVYDDRLFMKLYRVLEPVPRREVEVMLRLDEIGFNPIVAPVALWRADDADLALVREFVSGAVEGRALALTSLRDLLGSEREEGPADVDEAARRAGGDLAGELRRLGETTARLHLALSRAFGEAEPDLGRIADAVEETGDRAAAARLRGLGGVGTAIRLHGDYHLRRVMRTDVGWIVVGFGDDPSPLARSGPDPSGARFGLPLEDLADMCFALSDVASSLGDEAPAADASAEHSHALAEAWARRNKAAFVDGYLATPGVAHLLPRHPAAFHLLLTSLEEVRSARAVPSAS